MNVEVQLDDDIELDDDVTLVTGDVGVGGYHPPVSKKSNANGEFTRSTLFATFSILACLLFTAVIVLQVAEMAHLSGAYPESESIWPLK